MPQISTGKLREWSIFKGDNRSDKTDNSGYCPICSVEKKSNWCDHNEVFVSRKMCCLNFIKLINYNYKFSRINNSNFYNNMFRKRIFRPPWSYRRVV